ncbi:leucine-rich repeat-containing G-protein coupled receptor 4-like [Odontomachus brunneus]|uniref:leucine-rich repeat-containing G-protein coupled receptor 4-like n=1 Tax=Odontomachus brunneus TaxID=486640 RepID=UPI0013F29A2D|nr:leucine-rich repeat-containing G-protein coupled receptor 4-like [Odontomachus brunneus]XP_032684433.1 leucine-rich repeat-containing G-protein coupled receptor 4-like [Odontomachus brunneus]XP_032684434.1 leucine-rich repeat-containing G-protein coupled receptor 4-like [Odontomachus brunneus]XP_032684435.1 leucine-rich repeat-containing G-protein coupled receptor 4-like [Odontomachus brunneus]
MLSFIICLLPLAASVPIEPPSKNYFLDIDNDTLRNVRFVGEPSLQLNLSSMNLHTLQKNAFDYVDDIESLDLSNNSLTSLPEFVFSNLTKLKNLWLSNNQISNIRTLFVGLENLQLLDISHNHIRHLRRGYLFGLPKSTRILTDGNIFWSISTDVFANFFLKHAEATSQVTSADEEEKEEIDNIVLEEQKNLETLSKDTRVKLCKSDGIVTSLEILQKDEKLAEGCAQVPLDADKKEVMLQEQNITAFQEGWYQLQSLPIASLDLSNNEIAEIREATLNDLPAGLTDVNFLGNKIHRIWSEVIENEHLKSLNFKDNLIEEIEDNAFGKTKLHGLYLVDNQLESLNFVSTLPKTLTDLVLNGNRIISVPDGVFTKLSRLIYLYLEDNKIETLRNNTFQGLMSLHKLMLMRNRVTTIEPAAFKSLTALRVLDLSHNSVNNLHNGTFAELTALKELNLAWNKITEASFANLPSTLNFLYLNDNEIERLEEGSFVRTPRLSLSLTGNRISSIARSAFDLPTLRDLYLNNNNLTTIDGDSYEGLGHLRRLWLSENDITEIRKGSCKNLGSLYILDISRNPFHKLENGALYGLNTTPMESSLYIYENNLKEMQAGLFEDV